MSELPPSAGKILSIKEEIHLLREESERLTAALDIANAAIKQRSADAILPIPEVADGVVAQS